MMEFLLGMAGCAVMLAAFGLGWCVGHGAGRGAGQACGGSCPGAFIRPAGNPRCEGVPSVCPDESARPPAGPDGSPRHPPDDGGEADEMRAAFEAVMSYNSDTAYGLNGRIGGDET